MSILIIGQARARLRLLLLLLWWWRLRRWWTSAQGRIQHTFLAAGHGQGRCSCRLWLVESVGRVAKSAGAGTVSPSRSE